MGNNVWIACVVVFCGVVLVWFVLGVALPPRVSTNPADFGEQFGAVSALFSGLAFAGLIVTIALQQRQVALQYKGMEIHHRELSTQLEQLRIQNAAAERALFEARLFEMLRLHRECARDIAASRFGRDVGFRGMVGRLRELYAEAPAGDDEGFRVSAAFARLWDDHGGQLAQYCRGADALIEMVHGAPSGSRQTYVSIVQAHCAGSERILQFYYSRSRQCGDRTREQAELLAWFSNIPAMELFAAAHARWR